MKGGSPTGKQSELNDSQLLSSSPDRRQLCEQQQNFRLFTTQTSGRKRTSQLENTPMKKHRSNQQSTMLFPISSYSPCEKGEEKRRFSSNIKQTDQCVTRPPPITHLKQSPRNVHLRSSVVHLRTSSSFKSQTSPIKQQCKKAHKTKPVTEFSTKSARKHIPLPSQLLTVTATLDTLMDSMGGGNENIQEFEASTGLA